MPPQPMLQRRFYVFCLVHPGFCPVPSAFLSLRKNAERISMKFAGGIKPAPVALLVASRYALPGYGDRRVWVRGPCRPDHYVRVIAAYALRLNSRAGTEGSTVAVG